MANNLYALLVGVNDYPDPIPRLRGCLNDIAAMTAFLETRCAETSTQLHLHTLKNEEATRDAVIAAFRSHLGKAAAGDQALFGFSGHGSQEAAPPEFWHLEPDRLNETLVCWDSRTSGGRDLADKELASLIAEVADKNPRITILLDCCHSGSGSRLLNTRYVEPDRRQRPIESYWLGDQQATRDLKRPDGKLEISQGRHVLLAACRDAETAKEYNSKQRGAFSYFLLETLQQACSPLSYRDVFRRTDALIRGQVPNQSPQLEATHPEDLDLGFLGNTTTQTRPYFTVSYNQQMQDWIIDCGAVHGIPTPMGQETTQLAIFSFDAAADAMERYSQAIARASVIEVLPQQSRLSLSNAADLQTHQTYKAVIAQMPLPPLAVAMEGDEEGCRWVRDAIAAAGFDQTASMYVQLAADPDQAKFKVIAADGKYAITDPTRQNLLVSELTGYHLSTANQVVQRLEHMARWNTVVEMDSSATSQIPADAIELQIFQDEREITASPVVLEYQYRGGRWTQPTFTLKLTNRWERPLYCAVFDLTERYAIDPSLFEAGGVWLQPEEEAWALGRKPIFASVPKVLWEQGVTEYRDILKLIASTAEFDARLMAQKALDTPRSRAAVRSMGRRSGLLNQLMQRVQTRELGAESEEAELFDDWMTQQVSITTVRPLNSVKLPQSGSAADLGAGVKVHPHPALQANVQLTSLPQVSRTLDQPNLPAIFSQDSADSDRLYFTRSRGADPGLSVLELNTLVADSAGTVTPDEPLRISLEFSLGEGEYVLPIAFDGEFYLPLGRSQPTPDGADIVLDHLPPPMAPGERSLGGTIRIFFQKIMSRKLGLAFEYPQLSGIYLLGSGRVVYEKEPTVLQPQIAQAKRILLLIHGLFGNTPSLIADLQSGDACARFLSDRYDLILGLDYESFNTSVEDTARLLKQRLERVGLGANHRKHLDVVGFELGGLIGRWLVEREEGNAMVNHLVLVGAPNAGTPWATMQNWLTAALGIGLNSLSTVAWPVKVIGSLVAAMEAFDVTLDQMQPGSALLQSLAASPDPGVAYSVLYGNASINPSVLSTEGRAKSLLQRLLDKLLGNAANLAFLGQPNDLFASAHSLKLSTGSRALSPAMEESLCDHFTYFSSPEGQAALIQVLSRL